MKESFTSPTSLKGCFRAQKEILSLKLKHLHFLPTTGCQKKCPHLVKLIEYEDVFGAYPVDQISLSYQLSMSPISAFCLV